MAAEDARMRQVSIAELEEHLPEVEAGQRLTLVHGGKAVAEVVPIRTELPEVEPLQKFASEEERLKAVEEFSAFLEKGLDLGGFRIESRDELYDRD